jgi:hypothetical protein
MPVFKSVIGDPNLVEKTAPPESAHSALLLKVEQLRLRRLLKQAVLVLHQLLAANQHSRVLNASLLVARLSLVNRLCLFPLVHHLSQSGKPKQVAGRPRPRNTVVLWGVNGDDA